MSKKPRWKIKFEVLTDRCTRNRASLRRIQDARNDVIVSLQQARERLKTIRQGPYSGADVDQKKTEVRIRELEEEFREFEVSLKEASEKQSRDSRLWNACADFLRSKGKTTE